MNKARHTLIMIIVDLRVGGREKVVLELIRQLDKSRFNVILCSLKGAGPLFDSYVKACSEVKVFNMKQGVDLGLILSLSNYFKEKKADIVHTHNPGTLNYGCISALLARVPSIINSEHGFSFKERLRRRMADAFFRNVVDKNICVSNRLKRDLEKYMINKDKIITVYNGINISPSLPCDEPTLEAKKELLGFDGSDLIVGNVARLEKVKNHHMLIDAMKRVLEKVPRAKLLIVGDGSLRRDLESYARSLNIEDRVVFWGETDRVSELFEIMDIFVLSSTNEGISLTILEAMASGKPVVATDVGGNPEVVMDRETGRLVPSNDPDKMSQVIVDILKNREDAARMGGEGKKRVEQFFDINTMGEIFEELYITSMKRTGRSV